MDSKEILSLAVNAFDYIQNEIMIQSVVERGMIALQHNSMLSEIAARYFISQKSFDMLEPLKRIAKESDGAVNFAKDEIDKGYPTLLAHSSIAMWSAVEAFVENLLVGFVESDPRCRMLLSQKYPKLKLKTDETASRFIVRWEKEVESKQVVDRYVEMIAHFIEGFSFDSKRGLVLSELSEVRNAIMHRMGIVDKKFMEKVPHGDFKIGDRIMVTKSMYSDYHDACGNFIILFFSKDIVTRA